MGRNGKKDREAHPKPFWNVLINFHMRSSRPLIFVELVIFIFKALLFFRGGIF